MTPDEQNVSVNQERTGIIASRRRRWLTLERSEAIKGYIFISPWIIGLLVFMLFPMLASLYLSLTRYSVVSPPKYIGLSNYANIFKEPVFWTSVKNTLYYAVVSVPLTIIGALFCAILLNQRIAVRTLFRSVFFVPSITPMVAAVFLWTWILQPRIGPLNYVLGMIGIKGPGWLGSTRWAKPALILVSLWASVGGNAMITFLAALQGVPQELIEAAEIDGAGSWRKFWNVTIPLISPMIFFNLILGVIVALQVFDLAYVATAASGGRHELGSPAYSTMFYVLYLYARTFMDWDMGLGSALAWIFFVVVLILTYIQLQIGRRWVYYEYQEAA